MFGSVRMPELPEHITIWHMAKYSMKSGMPETIMHGRETGKTRVTANSQRQKMGAST